jgi:hypothetical protein
MMISFGLLWLRRRLTRDAQFRDGQAHHLVHLAVPVDMKSQPIANRQVLKHFGFFDLEVDRLPFVSSEQSLFVRRLSDGDMPKANVCATNNHAIILIGPLMS